MNRYRKLALTLAALTFSLCVKAQEAEVNGKVIDERGRPIEFVTVALKNAQGKYVQGCLTEVDGVFHIKADKGTYVLHLSHIGHNSMQQGISLSEGEKRTLADIVMRDSTNILHEVTVQSKRPLIKRELDRIVFNAERLNVAAVNFLDVLQSTPGVLISEDGISMPGKGNVHFDHKNIGKGGTLTIDADYIKYTMHDREELFTTRDENMQYLKHPSYDIDIYSAKTDVELPFTKGRSTFGCAYSHTRTDSRLVYERQNIGANLNDHFIYKENVAAAYADLTYRVSEKISVKAGLRGEFAHTNGLAVTGERSKKNWLDIFPTAYFSYAWNEESVLSASFAGRIQRPSYNDINPFVDHVDAHNITEGNPELKPQKSYTAEIGYTYKNLSVTGSGWFQNNVIGEYTEIDNVTKLVKRTYTNMLRNKTYDIMVSYNFDSCPWFDSYLDIDLFHIDSKPLKGINLARTNKTPCIIYLNNNFYFNRAKTFLCHWWAQYNSPERNASDAADTWYRMDVSLKWLLFNKHLSIGGEMMNLIGSHRKEHTESNGTIRTVDTPPYRVFKLSVTYSFGQKIKSNNRTRSNDALQGRLYGG